MQFEVTKRFSPEIAFTAEIDCTEDAPRSWKLRLAVLWAIKVGADLTGADLTGANLTGADLYGANLTGANVVDGGQRSDGQRFVGWISEGVLQIRAGCRNFSITGARTHWQETRGGTPLGDETMAILDHIEAVAKIRKLVTEAA